MASPFLSILSGFTKGAAKTITDQNEESRKRKYETDQLLGKTLLERSADANLLPEEAHALAEEASKKFGLKGDDQKNFLTGFRFLRLQHDEATRANQPKAKAPGVPEGTSVPTESLGEVPTPTSVSPKPAAPAMPAMVEGQPLEEQPDPSIPPVMFETGATASKPPAQAPAPAQEESLGEVPQRRTVGEIDFDRTLPMEAKKAKVIAQIQREAQRAMATGEIEDKIALRVKYDNTPYEDDVRQLLGMTPRSATGASTYLPGPGMRGEQIIALYPNHPDVMAGHITPGKLYNVSVGPDKKTPTGFFPREENTAGTGKEISGAEAIAMGFTQTMGPNGGAPVDPKGTYTYRSNVTGGQPAGVTPTVHLETVTSHVGEAPVTNAAGDIIAVPLQSGTRSGQVVPGGALGQVPSMPVGVTPSSPPTGNPTPGMPTPGRSRVIGAKPTSIPEATISKIDTAQNVLSQTEKLIETLPRIEGAIGPLTGRASDFSMQYLGGFAVPGEAKEFLTTIREMIANKAFERGGKTLPMGEQRIYTMQLPAGSDLPDTLVRKLKIFLPLFKKDYENQLRGLTGNQLKQLQGGSGLGNVPSPANTPGKPRDLSIYERP